MTEKAIELGMFNFCQTIVETFHRNKRMAERSWRDKKSTIDQLSIAEQIVEKILECRKNTWQSFMDN